MPLTIATFNVENIFNRYASLLAQAAADAKKLPVVLCNLNVDPQTDQFLAALLGHKQLRDLFPFDTRRHYYTSAKKISRLDYILPHKSLKVL